MRSPCVLVLAVAACGSAGLPPASPTAPPTSAPAPTPAPPSVLAPPPTPVAVVAPPTPAAAIPSFATVDFHADRELLLRAKVRVAGPQRLRHDAAPLTAQTTNNVGWLGPIPVLDADRDGNPRRLRLLCEDERTRVAVYMDVNDLWTTAFADAVLLPPNVALDEGADTPGVHFAAGATVERVAVAGGVAHVRYHGKFLDADGDMPASQVNVVYERATPAPPPEVDGELVRDVDLQVRPGGPTLGRIAKPHGVDNVLTVKRLAMQHGVMLVRYDEDDAYAIGWVPRSAVRAIPASKKQEWGLIGTTGGGLKRGVRLARGTLLTDPANGAVVGVVTTDDTFSCGNTCTAQAPLIEVFGCASNLELRAQR